jgi:alpha-galactosidase
MASIKFSSDRVMSLSDLKPQSVKQHGLLDTTMGWRIDRSVGGGPITMGRRVYSRGLGLHSFCELTYSLGGQYRALIATVGIDDVVRPGGDAELTFIGDGKKLLAPLRITGKGKPQAVRIPLAGVKSLVIRVDYGKDRLDVGDHVDFAGARLIK